MPYPCPECEEEIDCGCQYPNARPPCSGCENHVCFAEHDEERMLDIRTDLTEVKRAPAGTKLNAQAILVDLEWLLDRMECNQT